MIPSCCTAFHLLTNIFLLQYSKSLKVLAFRRTLTHISEIYPCISSSWTQWVKTNNRPNYNQELKKVLAWASSYYSNYLWSFFVFMGNLIVHEVVASLNYFYFIYTLFCYKSNRYTCLCNVGKCSSFRRRVKPSLTWFSWYGNPYATSISHKFY